jgi:hypothetical protein
MMNPAGKAMKLFDKYFPSPRLMGLLIRCFIPLPHPAQKIDAFNLPKLLMSVGSELRSSNKNRLVVLYI